MEHDIKLAYPWTSHSPIVIYPELMNDYSKVSYSHRLTSKSYKLLITNQVN